MANSFLLLRLLAALFPITSDAITTANLVQPHGGGNAKVPLDEHDDLENEPEE